MAHIHTFPPDSCGFFAQVETPRGAFRLQHARGSFHIVFAGGYSCCLPDFSRASQALDYALRLTV